MSGILFKVLIVYAIVVLLACIFQNRLIYLPAKSGLDPLRQAARLNGLKLWPEANGNYRGFIPDGVPSAARGTVIVLHGNAGAAIDRQYYVPPLQKRGYRVILAEYPGYGARGAKPSQAALAADARETVRTALEEFGGPVFLWGESLGCGVAAAAAADPDLKIDGIVMLTPWNNLPATAQSHYWFLPALWLVRDRYDNIRNLRQFHGPVAVLMADKDEVIPNRLTLSLYRNIHPAKRLWTFRDAGHNSWPSDAGLPWWSEVMDFVSGGPSIPGSG
ncbi:MAG: alpha/beta fold hydrolase [Acidobacteria bacterium]|nr:alpha/beta fold hydrolase [Acidobacteriota bacterium]